ncbi:eukaryotic translation initiation factor 4 gamma 1-like isoform X2 [Astyanax mexicanus]|uniref:eukaryotic translation initiation factor 4 gamma 1-like isoform X2 n=1 Tax=Astyanax mexicanus TaxID=7994 RepID=UPI0020CAD214|nr:eukaryotic translation initiation factor 4 gamma 1-like isoform X2 [Astyanax mexicanus]
MFLQQEINSDRPRSNVTYRGAKDHPSRPPLVRSGPPAPMKKRPQYVPQTQQTSTPDHRLNYKPQAAVPLEQKIQYDREFLLGFRFISPSIQKPQGLPFIPRVVLDKPNKDPLDSSWQQKCVQQDRQTSRHGWRRSTEPDNELRNETRKVISVSLNVQLNKAANAWRPGRKKSVECGEVQKDEAEDLKTQEMLRLFRSILNKLTPQTFDRLIQRVTELAIDTEERLRGVISLVFEKAVREPHFSEIYAKMCHRLVDLKVPTSKDPAVNVEFRVLLLHCCKEEFKKNKDEEIIEEKQKQLDAATENEERQQLKEELEEAKNKARRRSLGNIKFVGELFKLRMLKDSIIHHCVAKLLKDEAEESLECLSKLLSTVGKDADEKDKTRMDHYFTEIEEIVRARKTSSRIRFMLQDLLDLRRNKWVPRRADLGPKTIDQIHKEAALEENGSQNKVQQQQLRSYKDWTCGPINICPSKTISKMEKIELRPTVRQEEVPVSSDTLEDSEKTMKETPKETPEEAPKEIFEEAPKETPEEAPKEIFKEGLKETPEEAPKEIFEEAPKETPEEAPIEIFEEVPKETPEEAPIEIFEEAPKETPEEAPKEIFEEAPKETPEEAPKEIFEEAPKETPEEAPKETPEEAPYETPEDTDKPVSSSVLKGAPSALELPQGNVSEEAEEELPEETSRPENHLVDQTSPSAPVELTMTIEQETTNEETVYRNDVMASVKNALDELNVLKENDIRSAPDSNRFSFPALIGAAAIPSAIICSGLLLYHGINWLRTLV